ncbi:hypothetical protein [Caballeronia cordobensis]|uniref:hypothetical protein n=1 Tax=Caballeronia cordobensis TaxID=1353886 RepID=UPI001186F145
MPDPLARHFLREDLGEPPLFGALGEFGEVRIAEKTEPFGKKPAKRPAKIRIARRIAHELRILRDDTRCGLRERERLHTRRRRTEHAERPIVNLADIKAARCFRLALATRCSRSRRHAGRGATKPVRNEFQHNLMGGDAGESLPSNDAIAVKRRQQASNKICRRSLCI